MIMPQFNTFWFAGQIFWFSIAFGSFSLLSFRVIVPFIKKIQSDRKNYIDKMISDAKDLIEKANNLKQDINNKLHFAKVEANVIFHKAKKEIEHNNNSSNGNIESKIESYANEKMLEIKQKIELKKVLFCNSIVSFSDVVTKKCDIDNFVISKENISKIEKNLMNF